MSKLIGEYTAEVTGLMQTIAKEEEENILKAADLLSDKVNEGRLINIFGAGGHSAIAAMEIVGRAGGLAQVNPLFPVGTNIITAGPTTAKVTGLAPVYPEFLRGLQGRCYADIAVDNHVPYPDAILKLPDIPEEFAPTATTLTCFTLNLMMAETIRMIKEKGGTPEIWVSNNIPGCDEHNKPIHDKYRHRIHHLYPVW